MLDMEQSSQTKVDEGATSDTPAAYAATTYQPVVMVSGAPSAGAAIPPPSQGAAAYPAIPAQLSNQHQIAFQQVQQLHHHQQQHQQQQLQAFWDDQMAQIEQVTEFKLHSLPLARIKKIMKADEDVRMIAGEAPVVFAKACEMFILELTLRAWLHTEENKRRTLQKNDIAAAITRTDIFDFLVDIIPRDELKEDGMGLPTTAPQTMVSPHVPGFSIPFGLYANQQPIMFVWPQPEQQQQEQTSDDGQDE